MTGDATRIPFGLLFSLRSNLGQQWTLSILTVLAVAVSVALAVALYLGAGGVESELERTAESLRGAAQLEVTGGEVGIAEDLVEDVRAAPGVTAAAPVVTETVRLVGGPRDGQPLHLLGVDLLADRAFRHYTVVRQGLEVLDPLRLVVGADSVIVTEGLSRSLGLEQGGSFTVRSARGEHDLVVRGVLAPGGVADAYGGQIAVMDVYTLQELRGRRGWLDRIDVATDPGTDLAAVSAAIEARVGGRATVRRASNQDAFVRATVAALQRAGAVIAAAGVVVAALLSYGAVSVSVERRRAAFGLLRAAGLESRRVRRLVYVDSLVVAVVGTAVGVPAGYLLSGTLLRVFSGTTRFVQGTEVGEVMFTPTAFALGCAVGIGVAWIGALSPALRASRSSPLEAISGARADVAAPEARRSWLLAAAGAGVWAVLWLVPPPLPAVLQTGLVLLVGVLVVAISLGPLVHGITSPAGVLMERLIPGLGRVVAGMLRTRLKHARIAVASIAGLVAATASVLVVLHSVATTMDEALVGGGRVMVTASDPFQTIHRDLILPETAEAVRATPGVRAVFHHYRTETLFRGESIVLKAISADVFAERMQFSGMRGGDSRAVGRGMIEGGVLVTQGFARHFGVGLGDSIELATPAGPREFPVVGIHDSFTEGETGAVRMHIASFDELWPREGSSNLFIWVDEPREQVLARVQERAGGLQALFLTRSEQLDRFMRDQIQDSSGLLYLLVSVIAGLGGLCIANLLIGSIAEQSRDLGLFRSAGATSGQVSLLVVIDGGIIAWIGSTAGVALGLACSTTMMGLIEESFGWNVRYAADVGQLAALGAIVTGVSVLAGLYPGWRARRISPAEVLIHE